MKLIIGLGNPGEKYARSWHNLGFMAVEKIRQDLELPDFTKEKKFQAEITAGQLGKEKIILAKPLTFMNESGRTVQALVKYYKIPLSDIIIIHDDVDLPLGKIRLAYDSSSGGHKGIESIIEYLDSKKFARIKIGCHTDKTDLLGTLDFVLTDIAKREKKTVAEVLSQASSAAQTVMTDSIASAMNKYN